jgi:ABC-type polysaccharide/polyol phosphate transport system ATPase subunit
VARIILENVSAHFPIYGAQQRSLRKAILQRATGGSIEREGKNSERVVVKALTDISLTLNDGDRVGLIGHNGAGKSTLLKLMAGIYEPVSGTVKVEGRVTPLFDALPGLDSEDSGYENIITSGMLIGMTRRQIEAKIPEIEEFCELGEYLNLPVRTYSTGMTMRLGFALVTALDPGVLLMDEGFGTGDMRFAERAELRLNDFVGRSRIMVLASHSERTIRTMCNKAILLEAGRIVAFGPVEEISDRYRASVHAADAAAPQRQLAYNESSIRDLSLEVRRARTDGHGEVRFTRIVAQDESGRAKWIFAPGETIVFRFEYETFAEIDGLSLGLRFILRQKGFGKSDFVVAEITETLSSTPIEAGHVAAVELMLPNLELRPNQFSLYALLTSATGGVHYDLMDGELGLPELVIENDGAPTRVRGVFSLKHELKEV